ncbi:trafficking protein particle complex subunit 9-like [Argopecten irradians]|uniref:trafficking protein particle complex subunit 9-like n=1 Tax=Argopecten irradians TaxID=31199 RepID=UPI0037231143
MSQIDYGQTAEDHQAFLILVRNTGQQLCNRSFNRAWERIRKLNYVNIPGQKRVAWVRYKRSYSKENNEWGDFQAHRKVLGLVSIGQCSDQDQFEELFSSYRKVKEEYATTLFNSRLFVFGMNTDGSPLKEEEDVKHEGGEKSSTSSSRSGKSSPVHSEDSGVTPDLSPTETGNDCDLTKTDSEGSVDKSTSAISSQVEPTEQLQPVVEQTDSVSKPSRGQSQQSNKSDTFSNVPTLRPHSNSLTKESTGAEVLFSPDLDMCSDLEEKIKDFITSIFFVLEGKRLDRSFERADKMQLLCAPFEKKDYVGLDTDTKSYRKKCQGRLRKHLGDLCLQAGIPGEAILHYQTAIDILRPVNDWLWIGACFEGICSASVIVRFPKSQTPTLRRNFSLQATLGSSMSGDTKTRTGSVKNSYTNGYQDLEESPKSALGPDDIVEKYREALVHYSKFKGSGMIEMEACLKACRVLVIQRKYLQASDFLQNVVYINLQTSDEDKINRYCTLSQLYSQIGFERKASFFKRIAAMQCVSPQNPQPNWKLCHSLVMQCLDGYSICVDPKDIPSGCVYGWPVLQARVLNELIFSARRTGNHPVAIRHMSLLLHTLFDTLSTQDRRDIINTLQTLTAKSEGTMAPLALESGVILPPIPLSNIPQVRSLKLIPLPPHLQPVKIASKVEKLDTGPFIFTPLSLGQTDVQNKTHVDFCWVEQDMCEVQLQVFNPLPDELPIQQMSLTTDGVDIEAYPTNPTLPAESGPNLVKILSRPRSSGDLSILGYRTHLLGMQSQCRLHDLPDLRDLRTTVTVIPALPQITLTASLPKVATFISVGNGANVVTSGTASIYAGQSKECMITIRNTSNQPVEKITVSLDSHPDQKELQSKVFQWSQENLDAQLPLQPSGLVCFTVCIYGYSDFLSSKSVRSSSQSSEHSNSDEYDSMYRSQSSEHSNSDEYDSMYRSQSSEHSNSDEYDSMYRSQSSEHSNSDEYDSMYRSQSSEHSNSDEYDSMYRPQSSEHSNSDEYDSMYRSQSSEHSNSDEYDSMYRSQSSEHSNSDEYDSMYRSQSSEHSNSDEYEYGSMYRSQSSEHSNSDEYDSMSSEHSNSDEYDSMYRSQSSEHSNSDEYDSMYRSQSSEHSNSDEYDSMYRSQSSEHSNSDEYDSMMSMTPCTGRLTIQIEKCVFPDPGPELDVADRLQMTKPPPPVISHYSQHLDKFIHILWTMCGTKHCGKMGTEHLTWSQPQLDLITVSQVSWNVSVNDQSCSAHSIPVVCTGTVVNIEILITFRSGVSYTSAVLTVSSPLLTDHTSVHSWDTDQVTVLGSQSYQIAKVDGEDSARYKTSYLFHYSGTYRFNVKCVATATDDQIDHIWKCHDIQVRVIDEE